MATTIAGDGRLTFAFLIATLPSATRFEIRRLLLAYPKTEEKNHRARALTG
jgi:hypothetical protein